MPHSGEGRDMQQLSGRRHETTSGSGNADTWSAVWRLSRQQGGVLRRAQLYELGVSESTVGRRVARGEWRAVGKNVLVHSLSPDDVVTRALAVAHAVGPQVATLTGSSAIALHGMHAEPPWDALEQSFEPWIITMRRVDVPVPARVVRAEPPTGDSLMGVQVANPDRVLLDLLRLLPTTHAKTLGFRALQAYQPEKLQNLLRAAAEHYVGHRGVQRVRWLLEAATVDVHSDGEVRMAELLRAAGIAGWRANAKIRVAGRNYRADFYLPEFGLIIEVDGRAWHGVDRMDVDHVRQNALITAGYRVLRFSWWRIVNEPAGVVAEIRRVGHFG
jgi:very-short-patch-repair endonuclease